MKMLKMSNLEDELGLAKTTIYRMIEKGEFMNGYGEGRYRRWPEQEVAAYQIFLWGLPDKIPDLEQNILEKIKTMADKAKVRITEQA